MKGTILKLSLLLLTFTSNAQENILVETNSTQLILKITYKKDLKLEYYGEKLNSINDVFNARVNTSANAYPAFVIVPIKPLP